MVDGATLGFAFYGEGVNCLSNNVGLLTHGLIFIVKQGDKIDIC